MAERASFPLLRFKSDFGLVRNVRALPNVSATDFLRARLKCRLPPIPVALAQFSAPPRPLILFTAVKKERAFKYIRGCVNRPGIRARSVRIQKLDFSVTQIARTSHGSRPARNGQRRWRNHAYIAVVDSLGWQYMHFSSAYLSVCGVSTLKWRCLCMCAPCLRSRESFCAA